MKAALSYMVLAWPNMKSGRLMMNRFEVHMKRCFGLRKYCKSWDRRSMRMRYLRTITGLDRRSELSHELIPSLGKCMMVLEKNVVINHTSLPLNLALLPPLPFGERVRARGCPDGKVYSISKRIRNGRGNRDLAPRRLFDSRAILKCRWGCEDFFAKR